MMMEADSIAIIIIIIGVVAITFVVVVIAVIVNFTNSNSNTEFIVITAAAIDSVLFAFLKSLAKFNIYLFQNFNL